MAQYTLGGIFDRSGVGLHSGILTNVRVLPAVPGEGRYFVRVDLPGSPIIPARVEAVYETRLSTELQALITSDSTVDKAAKHSSILPQSTHTEARVRTVEHLLAALACSGVDDARIEIDGPEVPLLDGSAQVWVEAIQEVGVVATEEDWKTDALVLAVAFQQDSVQSKEGKEDTKTPGDIVKRHTEVGNSSRTLSTSFALEQPIWVHQGDAFVAALPAPTIRFTYGIDFESPAIGNQWHSWTPMQESFATSIAPARTFGLAHQVEQLRQAGLIKGGSLENALVCDETGWLNPPLRFSNEPARHKLLDLVGDLSLLGTFPVAHFLAYKASHHLHVQLAQELAQQMG
ncbi:UDP-3-O-acyl-N-acetylglucosamine deacetylase [Allocoleopsis franciscana]|uniref:UDP-3-O-acyl-N-acetylglucosamine deacetylase n=1 Tax=Allocoleopsis franciscana PCC 7113 TaxID=1173027 RepID=K9WLR2_9CYAN|nr:UDP-3-O-acyl-N-acetylglucosamine deacetylase [Allocoleopsis franciscana]AFZ20746.1 UDP-3-O-acyl-N-acetylglucosamine deacetylase [Allocoleopsis franciscana PCC 7113]